MKARTMWFKRAAMLSAMAACALKATGAEPVSEQVKACFERQYAEQFSQFTIPYQIQVADPIPDGDDGFYTADVIMHIAPTSAIYKTVIEPTGETTWTTPHIDDDIDESLLTAAQRDEMNARIQRFLLTDFTVVAPIDGVELNSYLKSTARFRIDLVGTDNAKVVGSGNEGKINFSSVRFFELHSAADVASERVFVAGTAAYEKGKQRHFRKRFEIGTACSSINENAGFVKALRIMSTNSTAVADETLGIYTRNMGTPKLRRLREQSKEIRDVREVDVQAIRNKHDKRRKGMGFDSGNDVSKKMDVEFEQEMRGAVERRQQELSVVGLQITQEHHEIHDAIRKDPGKYVKEPKARFDASVNKFNTLVK